MPPHHPSIITCGTVEKLSKMAGNSASKPLNSTLSCICNYVPDLWRMCTSSLKVDSRYYEFNISKFVFLVICKCANNAHFHLWLQKKVLQYKMKTYTHGVDDVLILLLQTCQLLLSEVSLQWKATMLG